jgi:hypothetical protein
VVPPVGRHAGIAAVSLGLGESALVCAGLIGGAAILHAGLAWLGSHGAPDVLPYRPMIAGVMAGLATVLLQNHALR